MNLTKRILLITILFSAGQIFIQAQTESLIGKNDKSDELSSFKPRIESQLSLQLWTTYTFGQQVYDEYTHTYNRTNNTFNTQLRRARFGFTSHLSPRLKTNIVTAWNFVGSNAQSATYYAPYEQSHKPIIWSMHVEWRLLKNSPTVNLVSGYFLPQIGRESITRGFDSNSFEKSLAQNYLRRSLTGTNQGRAPGLMLGGIIGKNVKIRYDFGIFSTPELAAELEASPLYTGRVVVMIGDSENEHYGLRHKLNFDNQRRGVSIGMALAHQDRNRVAHRNQIWGIDWLANYDNWNIDGEFYFYEKHLTSAIENIQNQSFSGYFRLGYNIYTGTGHQKLEPVLSKSFFVGEKSLEGQIAATSAGWYSGIDQSMDVGINYYSENGVKISLFYVMNHGSSAQTIDPIKINSYFYQNGTISIKRGNYLGMGFVSVI